MNIRVFLSDFDSNTALEKKTNDIALGKKKEN